MNKYKGIPQPQSWSEITLRQFSEYNKLIVDFQEFVEGLNEDNEKELNQLLVSEVTLNFNICEVLSKLPSEEVYALDIALVKEYIEGLTFLVKNYEPKEIKYFSFKETNYNVPDSLPINTKFGQYVESLQAEMNERHTDKNSVIYLAHQIAHIVDNGEDWNGADRDKLALEFEELPASIGLDFAFFLSKKCQTYSLAYLLYEKAEQEKQLPFIKRTSQGLVGLKHYMNWRRLKYLISLIKLRLTVFYILTQERFSSIYRILQRKVIMSQR